MIRSKLCRKFRCIACAVGISFPLYSLYKQENITEQEAYKIGEEIFKQTTWHENPVIEIRDAGRTWYMHALCKWDVFDTDYMIKHAETAFVVSLCDK